MTISRRTVVMGALGAPLGVVLGGSNVVHQFDDPASAVDVLAGALAPWHMWGTSETMLLDGSVSEQQSQQLVKINYGRPENWRFLFAAQLESDLAALDTLTVTVDLIVGLGRSFVKLPHFWGHQFTGAANAGIIVWDTKDTSPALNELIVAQDLQCSARLSGSFNPTLSKRLTISAFFCPNVHIRPEWFSDVANFRGGEENGS